MATKRDELDREEILRLLQREVDGDLGPAEAERLERALDGDPALAAERRELRRMVDVLEADRIPVREGFERSVMEALPTSPPWTRKRAWAFPLAAALALVLGSTLFLALGAGAAGSTGGLVATLVQFLAASALAGAGLLAASWQGLGMALGELLDAPGWVAFGAGVLALDLLLIQLLRRRRAAAARRTSREE